MKDEENLNNKHICSATMDHIGKYDNCLMELLTCILIILRIDETKEADCGDLNRQLLCIYPSSIQNNFYRNTMISFLKLMFELVFWVQNPLMII